MIEYLFVKISPRSNGSYDADHKIFGLYKTLLQVCYPPAKWNFMISLRIFICELSQELLEDLRLKILLIVKYQKDLKTGKTHALCLSIPGKIFGTR